MQPREMMGFVMPGDQKIPVAVRDWNGMKRAIWRSKEALGIAEREALAILDLCEHSENCPALKDETQPCLSERYEKEPQRESEDDVAFASRPGVRVQEGCLNRELRMSALVILNAARVFAPIDARRAANEPYFAPSREYFSEVIAELGAAQIECDALRAALLAAGVPVPSPVAPTPSMLTGQTSLQLESPAQEST